MSEVELKLEIDPADLDRLLSSDLLANQGETVQQQSTYFDTGDNALFSEGFTLRIRRADDARVQTIKAAGPNASTFARKEWERSITGDEPILDHSTPLLNEFGDIVDQVGPKFEVINERRIWNLVENGSRIEMALDCGVARAVDREAGFVELELELKEGRRQDLFNLARKVEATVPIKFGVLSKAERGFRLLEAARIVVKAEPIELNKETSTVCAFQEILQACFRHFRLNETILTLRQATRGAI